MLPDNIEEAHKMIESLRKENADRRVKSKAYEEAFSEFNDQERQFLLDLVATTAKDQKAGAIAFRDLAYDMLKNDPEVFLDGLDIELPSAPAEEAEEPEQGQEPEGEEEVSGLTEEQMQKILDEREAKAAEERAIQGIFKEIEDLGFEPGSKGFMSMLSLGQSLAAVGEEVDFKALAPQVKAVFSADEAPEADAESEDTAGAAAEKATEEATKDEEAKRFPSTATAGGAGGAPTEKATDWVAEAKAEGRDLMQVARERAERRLSADD